MGRDVRGRVSGKGDWGGFISNLRFDWWDDVGIGTGRWPIVAL